MMILFAIVLAAAVATVLAPNLVRAVLWLGVTLAATAGLYASLGASFLAGVQVLLYVGGVVTLMIFGVMLTRRHEGITLPDDRRSPWRGAVVAGGLFAILAVAIERTDFPAAAPSAAPVEALAKGLAGDGLVAFEGLSLLLLAAIVGAVVIARRKP